jgi:hypothetical protein
MNIILRPDDAFVIHRWLELVLDGRKFDNPLVAMETEAHARQAKKRLEQKLNRLRGQVAQKLEKSVSTRAAVVDNNTSQP